MKLIKIKKADANGESRDINRSASLIADEAAEALKRAVSLLDNAMQSAKTENDKDMEKVAANNVLFVKKAIAELSKVKA